MDIIRLLALLLSLPWNGPDKALVHQVMLRALWQQPKISNEELTYLWNLTQLQRAGGERMGTEELDPFVRFKSIITTDERQIRFYAYSPASSHGREIHLKNAESVISARLGSASPIKILIHGFQQNYKSEFPQRMKDAYMGSGEDVNVVCVDWGPLASSTGPLSSIFYPVAVENVPRVAEKVAEFISFLKGQGIIRDLSTVHLIGFSLGAHAAGMAGTLITNRLYRKIGRITGLDPAGPKYTSSQPFSRRLDPTDAHFVDVVHTNTMKLGYPGQLGHVDFYPNGGQEQPNCEPRNHQQAFKHMQLLHSIQHLFAATCSHSLAPVFFTKSIKWQLPACRCSSWREFRRTCGSKCRDQIIFGEHVPHTARGKYFLDVNV